MSLPAPYHLLVLPDGAWETVDCLAAMIRCHATASTVIVDVSAVNRLTIDALAILVRKAMRLHSIGGQLLLVGPTPAMRRLIERTGSAPLLRTFPGKAAAVRSLSQDGRTWRPVDLTEGRGTLFTDTPPTPT
ncbi:STAS domain-containing protein [Streptomyces sp. NPDC050617]|uniref:STAS domain-containing protein n=1 Tax=Streptomyces sp. NPDC050617 TaxID=3154628 RepID=UPI00344750C0